MSDTSTMAAGVGLLTVGSIAVLALFSGVLPALPPAVGAAGMVALAAGALLVGVSGIEGRPV